ncbi:hypothetical protein Y032_0374g210 [Ancylostoma ceylanicum]|nr:hypothetical protein Y032_0374g210 [Ancylostoma ceylanicum]
MADLKSGIRYCLLYDFRRGRTVAESHRDLFRSGKESLEDDARGRPPLVVDMEQLKEAIEDCPNQTTGDLENRPANLGCCVRREGTHSRTSMRQ